jgi:general stress protein YciG
MRGLQTFRRARVTHTSSDGVKIAQRARKRRASIRQIDREGVICQMAMDDVEAMFRARMRALARKGGAVTKQRHGYDPTYYRDIGRLGGSASVAARKARILAELEGRPCEPATTVASSAQSPPQNRRHLTLADILGEEEMLRQRGVLRS